MWAVIVVSQVRAPAQIDAKICDKTHGKTNSSKCGGPEDRNGLGLATLGISMISDH